MKILHISKYYHPFRGGIEKFIKELSEGMVKNGHEIKVLSSSECREKRIENIGGVDVVRMPRLGVIYSQPLTLSLFWHMRQYLDWADVVHIHTPNPLAELAFLLNDNKKPTVVTYHCDVVRQRKLMKIYGPVAQRVLSSVDKIVVSTPNHLEYSLPLKDHLQRCEVIPFGINEKTARKTMEFNGKVQKIREKYGDYFLFIGRLVPYKGVDVLLRAMQKMDKKLVCIGEGPRWEIWHQLAIDLGVQDKVTFLGKVSDDSEFAAYIEGCQSLVLPSIDESEAFGIVLIEAMAHGKPVITTKLRSGVSWVNQAGVTGLEVAPGDAQGLFQAMEIMANNHEMRLEMGRAARKRFEEHFQVADMVSAYENIYMASADARRIAA